ncbi:uncharacterized protein LOC109716812 [Ananas comosus]|uniref:Uncharacterized protein LOC109716812 n=1 Tax=Ananas comosus TaxID=4615 RepID=A0A6P5FQL9_ANACO|nr:uncharacterized protein LOC109716812 [Ananas comosus]
MGVSISVVAAVSFLHLLAFVLAIGAESRRSTGRVVPDEYDDRTYCAYDSNASTAYGVAAFFVLLASQALLSGVTRCLCFGRGLAASGSRTCAIAAFVLSWVTCIVAEACLVAGSARNAYHTKYVGYYIKRDLTSCAALRKGVFAAAAALVLVSLVASLVYYWNYSRAATGGWVKHQNEGGVGMTDYGTGKGKDESGGTATV